MDNVFKSFISYRSLGIGLIITSVLGYVFISDDFGHPGEILGTTCVLFAGVIFILIESGINIFKKLAIQWISFALLISIPIGGIILDNMPLGIIICFAIGSILSFVFSKKSNSKSHGE
jgi:hypothetical protein